MKPRYTKFASGREFSVETKKRVFSVRCSNDSKGIVLQMRIAVKVR